MKHSEKNKARQYVRNIMMLMCVAMLAGILMPGVRAEAGAKKEALKAYSTWLES